MELNNRQHKVVEATEPYILCLASAASGKALPNSTIIPTLNGPKSVGDIKIGDYLFDRNGKPTQVLGVYPQGKLEVYELTLGDGRKAKCSKEHIWSVNKTTWRDKNSFREMTVEEILNSSLINSSRGANFYIPCSQAIEYPKKEYKIHPYIIGAFLGDGCCKEHQLTISSEDDVIPSHIADLLGNAQIKRRHENNYSWSFSNANGKIYTDILPKELVCYSYEKRIPYEYKYGSIEQRYELIRGLMDTDGSISKDRRINHAATATVRFTSTSYGLIKDMQEVLGSLGYVSKIKRDERANKYTKYICYDLTINIDNVEKEKLFWLPRKKDIALSVKNKKQQRRYDRTSIRSIVSLNYKEEMTCFYVDNEEHLFLMNDFIVTHNTRTLTERIKYLIEVRKINPSDIVAISFTNMAADEIKRRIGTSCEGAYIGTVHGYANKVCLANGIDTSRWIKDFNFDEIIKRAVQVPQSKYKKVKHILIDECQDLSSLEYSFLEKIPAENRFYTGDNRQCQPAGTKVMLRNNIIKNIEDVIPGDNIVYYIPHDGYMSGINLPSTATGKIVLKTASREFVNDNLITLTTENHLVTKYTPNHIGYIKLHQCEYNHAVYLMCDNNNRFRIGKIPFTCTNKSRGNPWRDKMYAEGCTKIWILDVFKTDKEARLLETKLSYKYRIPQTCWQQDKVSWSQKDLDYIYDGLDTYSSARDCLKEFHRDIRYPLLDKNMEKSLHIHFARNAVTEIFACNIMPKVMDVLVYDKEDRHHKRYENIINIDYDYITEPIQVYSLETETGNYIADGILTHNCIYQFKGCSDEYLVAMYYDKQYTKYFLTENYRNAPNIIDFAEGYIYNANPIGPPSQPVKTQDGAIEKCSFSEALDELEWSGNWGSWFILTRTNNELVEAQDLCNEREIPNVTFKKGDLDLLQLDALVASNKVKILTIHTAKGLENKNVIVTGARTYNEEERKICYVAATRAENNLYWCPAIAKRHKRGQGINRRAEAGRLFDKSGESIIF